MQTMTSSLSDHGLMFLRETSSLSTVALTLVKIDSSIAFGDQETADDYAKQVAALLARNRHRDDFAEY